MFFEFVGRFFRENLAQHQTNRVDFLVPERIRFRLFKSLKVHIHLEFRQRRRHQLTVARENVATVGLHAHTVVLHTLRHLLPIVVLGGHNIHRFTHNGKRQQRHHNRNGTVARHNLLMVKFAHLLISFNSFNSLTPYFLTSQLLTPSSESHTAADSGFSAHCPCCFAEFPAPCSRDSSPSVGYCSTTPCISRLSVPFAVCQS